jgi:hypothetical protein
MRFSTFLIFIIGAVRLFGDLNHGRMSIIPEYDQNMVTILFSGHRESVTQNNTFLFTVPSDVDSVSQIKTNPKGELEFVLISTRFIKGLNWVEVPKGLDEFAFMINSTKFPEPGNRYFEYELSFSETVIELDFEIQEPLAAENFEYTGFKGESSQDAHGQTIHSIQWTNIPQNNVHMITFSYMNTRGLTTRSTLNELMKLSQPDVQVEIPPQKIKRHSLYIWEPMIALAVVSLFTMLVLNYYQNGKARNLNCLNCGNKLSELDKFCPECGEKI